MKLSEISVGMLVAIPKDSSRPVKLGSFIDWKIGYVTGLSYKYCQESRTYSIRNSEDANEVIPLVLFTGDSVATGVHPSNLVSAKKAGF